MWNISISFAVHPKQWRCVLIANLSAHRLIPLALMAVPVIAFALYIAYLVVPTVVATVVPVVVRTVLGTNSSKP